MAQISTGEILSGYEWTRHTESAAFPKSYNFQLFTHHDTLWAFHHAGNWFSLDGKTWIISTLENAISNLAFLDYVQFNNSIYGLGHLEGNIEKFNFSPVIYQTTDLKKWTVLSKESNLPNRFFYHPFVYKHKLWIIGGSDGRKTFADTWSSTDAVHWTREAHNQPFGNREGSQFVVLKDTLYMLNNDAWASTDAIHWTKLTNEIAKGEQVFGYAALAYDQRIWLLGCNRNGKFTSKVYTSKDGRGWTATDAPWSPRGGIAACIYNNRIYMTGGKYGGLPNEPNFIYSNDVWSLGKTGNK